MAATFNEKWTGTVSAALLTAGNWSGDGIGAGDEAQIASAAENLTGGDNGAVALDILSLERGMTFNVGSSGTPWHVDATDVYLRTAGKAFLDGAYTKVYLDTLKNDDGTIVLNGVNTHTIALLVAIQGGATIAGGTVTLLYTTHGGALNLKVDTGAAVTTGRLDRGSFINEGTWTTLDLLGGLFTGSSNQTTTTANLGGGRYVLNGGTLTTCNLGPGGTLDLGQTSNELTIGTINAYGGEVVKPMKLSFSAAVTVNVHAPSRGALAGVEVGTTLTWN